jgi:hypothetical protein
MTKQLKYSWLDYSLLKPYNKVLDLFLENHILDLFADAKEIQKVIALIQQKATEFNQNLVLKVDNEQNLVFFESTDLSGHRLLNKLAKVMIKNAEELELDVSFYQEDKYKNEMFELFLQGLGVYFLKIKLLTKKSQKFKKNKAQKILLFSLVLNSKLENLAIALDKLQKLGFQDEIIDSTFFDLDKFMDVLLTYLDPKVAGISVLSLADEICLDFLEVMLKHRFLFKKKNEFVSKVFNLMSNSNHPLFDILEKIYYQECLIEMQYEKHYEMEQERKAREKREEEERKRREEEERKRREEEERKRREEEERERQRQKKIEIEMRKKRKELEYDIFGF